MEKGGRGGQDQENESEKEPSWFFWGSTWNRIHASNLLFLAVEGEIGLGDLWLKQSYERIYKTKDSFIICLSFVWQMQILNCNSMLLKPKSN